MHSNRLRDSFVSYLLSMIMATILCCLPGFGQEGEVDEIETERDSFTQALSTVGQGRFAVESAWSFIDNKNAKDTHSLPELLLRYGLTENVELQFGTNYEVGGEPNLISGGGAEGFPEIEEPGGELEEEAKIFYGLKTRVTDQNGWLPESAFTLSGYTPTSGPETTTSLLAGYVFGWELPGDWHWASEVRYRFASAEGDHFNTWAPSTVLKRSFGERTEAHMEYFGIFSDGSEQELVRHFISPGIHYLLTPDFEVGTRVGWGLNEQSANFFSNIGIGFRY
ncbi:MAG: transporter [bacterium]|nr:transporter [bacterium]